VVNLNDLIRAHLKSPEFKQMLSFHPDVTVKTDLDDHLLPIMGSPVHFSKALMNLVFNAAESMTAGGQMVISTCNRYLDFPIKGYDYVQEGEYAVLSIADCGVGISQEDQMRIFEPFYTKKTMGRSGTGLGMAVVWGTVKDHKGYIDLQSTQGEGTVVTLYFPITRELPSDNKIDFSLEKIRGNKETILVIDDVREQRDIAATILTRLGYRVNTRSSGEEAVRYLALNHADLIVLDMIMDPGMGGLETYRQIIAHTPGQRAIIASGYSESQDIHKALEIGAGRYLKKPYTLIGLGMAVWEELHTRDPRRAGAANRLPCNGLKEAGSVLWIFCRKVALSVVDRLQQFGGCGRFADKCVGPRPAHIHDHLRMIEHREAQNAYIRQLRLDPPRRFDAVHFRHSDIHNHQIRF
jgi:two-component system, cell cycle sensor histidine kinase and response regulator CckA